MPERQFVRQLCQAWMFVHGEKWRCRRPQYHLGDCEFRGDSTHNHIAVAELMTIDQIAEAANG